jgi:hypothetical protein
VFDQQIPRGLFLLRRYAENGKPVVEEPIQGNAAAQSAQQQGMGFNFDVIGNHARAQFSAQFVEDLDCQPVPIVPCVHERQAGAGVPEDGMA